MHKLNQNSKSLYHIYQEKGLP